MRRFEGGIGRDGSQIPVERGVRRRQKAGGRDGVKQISELAAEECAFQKQSEEGRIHSGKSTEAGGGKPELGATGSFAFGNIRD